MPRCVLLVWRSLRVPTIYARKQRPASNRQKRDEILKEEISRVYANNYDAFGARKMHSVLNREPDPLGRGHVARCTIERLMKNLGLHGIKTAKAPNTTRSAPRENCPADLVDRHFAAFAPDRLWVADITYVHTFTGWVYVALVTDVFNREIVGWQVSRSLHTELALDALQRGGDLSAEMWRWRPVRAGAPLGPQLQTAELER